MKLLPKILAATVILTALLLAVTLSSCGEDVAPSPDFYLSAYREYNGDGAVTLERTYDPNGRLLAETEMVIDRRMTTAYTYDGDDLAREDRYVTRIDHRTYQEYTELVSYTLHTRSADVVEQKTYNDSGTLIGWVDAEYDEEGRQTSEVIRDTLAGEVIYSTSTVYTETENVFMEQHYDGSQLKCQRTETVGWDDVGAVVTVSEYRDGIGVQRTTTYYEDTRVVKVEGYGTGGFFTGTEEYIYNEDGRLIEMRTLNTHDAVVKTTTYTYDSHGNCVLEETVRTNGTVEKTVEYVYLELPEGTPS